MIYEDDEEIEKAEKDADVVELDAEERARKVKARRDLEDILANRENFYMGIEL